MVTNVSMNFEICPADALGWLDQHRYSKQRNLRQTEVNYFCEQLRNGEWVDNATPVTVVTFGESLTLIDGQHRIMAVAQSGIPAKFILIEHKVDSMKEADLLYSVIDSGAIRTPLQRFKAVESFSELEARISSRLYTAYLQSLRIIGNRFVSKGPKISTKKMVDLCKKYEAQIIEISEHVTLENEIYFRKRELMSVLLRALQINQSSTIGFISELSRCLVDNGYRASRPAGYPPRTTAYRFDGGPNELSNFMSDSTWLIRNAIHGISCYWSNESFQEKDSITSTHSGFDGEK